MSLSYVGLSNIVYIRVQVRRSSTLCWKRKFRMFTLERGRGGEGMEGRDKKRGEGKGKEIKREALWDVARTDIKISIEAKLNSAP